MYVPREELTAAGIDPELARPFYRTWGLKGRTVILKFYAER